MAKKVVIIGGVAGGASAAARLRRLDEQAQIILFERDNYISFANCGLPYYIGGVIENRNALLIQSPERFKKRFNIDVRVKNEVLKIERKEKQVRVKELTTGRTYSESYDKLVLSPGAEPVKLPVAGNDSERIFTVRNIPDVDAINTFIDTHKPKRTVVVGAGYIGLEMAENLRRRGLLVAIVEMVNQVLPSIDKEMANLLHHNLQSQNIALWLNDAVSGFQQIDSQLIVSLKSGMKLSCDFAILAAGVKPEVKLAEYAELEISSTGGIKVNEYLQTNDPDIYALGDAIDVEDFVLGSSCLIPLAGPANKQGRIVADNICGRAVKYKGTQGTAILKVFDQTVAMTGVSEKTLKKTDIKYEKLYIHPANHASYYPGVGQMHIKLLFTKPEGKILGVQIVGHEGVDKRIDVFATAIRAGMTVFDLQELELAYAPPYGSGKDPVNMAGYVAANTLDGTADTIHWDELDNDEFIIDVRTPREFARGNVPGSVNIYVNDLRNKLKELPIDKTINAYCTVGVRSYIACRILQQNGFNVRNLSGGYVTYRSYTSHELLEAETAQQLKEEFCTGL